MKQIPDEIVDRRDAALIAALFSDERRWITKTRVGESAGLVRRQPFGDTGINLLLDVKSKLVVNVAVNTRREDDSSKPRAQRTPSRHTYSLRRLEHERDGCG